MRRVCLVRTLLLWTTCALFGWWLWGEHMCQLSKSCNEQEGSEVVGVDGSAAVSLAFANEVIRFSRFNTADPGL